MVRFPELLGITHRQARDSVSDHAPVYLLIDGDQLNTAAAASAGQRDERSGGRRQSATAENCTDLNRAPAKALEAITHIGPERAEAVVEGRPWDGVGELDQIDGIGPSRLEDIQRQGEACVR